ncbi:hypothetical protein HDU67_005111 [Dinochytrium kinnereticum]|nr:hypothetical protein HDU67_005111 [Dinochytrium kinnereticum]
MASFSYNPELTVGSPIGFTAWVLNQNDVTSVTGTVTLVSGSRTFALCPPSVLRTPSECPVNVRRTPLDLCYTVSCNDPLPPNAPTTGSYVIEFSVSYTCTAGRPCPRALTTRSDPVTISVPASLSITSTTTTTAATASRTTSALSTRPAGPTTSGAAGNSNGGSDASSSGFPIAAIAGILGAIFVIILVVAGFIFYRRSASKKRDDDMDKVYQSGAAAPVKPLFDSNAASASAVPPSSVKASPTVSSVTPTSPQYGSATVPQDSIQQSPQHHPQHPQQQYQPQQSPMVQAPAGPSPMGSSPMGPVGQYGGGMPMPPEPHNVVGDVYSAAAVDPNVAPNAAAGYPGYGYGYGNPVSPAGGYGYNYGSDYYSNAGTAYPGYYDENGAYHYFNAADDPRYQQGYAMHQQAMSPNGMQQHGMNPNMPHPPSRA